MLEIRAEVTMGGKIRFGILLLNGLVRGPIVVFKKGGSARSSAVTGRQIADQSVETDSEERGYKYITDQAVDPVRSTW